MKYNVWLNGCVVASYKQKKRALDKALALARCGKYTKQNDELYVLDPWGNKYRYL